MISIVCVFNRKEILEECLLSGLAFQNANYELVLVDNSKNAFDRASIALNYGGRQARGDYVAFIHQDVFFYTENWLERVEQTANSIGRFGWLGVAGMSKAGRLHGFLKDCHALICTGVQSNIEVQTLDEVVLLCPRDPTGQYFDEDLNGWHAYGADSCIAANMKGLSNYVLSAPIWHRSNRSNSLGLKEAHDYLRQKYSALKTDIHTLSGSVLARSGSFMKAARKCKSGVQRIWVGDIEKRDFTEALNGVVSEFQNINCFYPDFPHPPIVTESFTQFLGPSKRSITNYFSRPQKTSVASISIVETELSTTVIGSDTEIDTMLSSGPLVLCVYEADLTFVTQNLGRRYRYDVIKSFRFAGYQQADPIYLVSLL